MSDDPTQPSVTNQPLRQLARLAHPHKLWIAVTVALGFGAALFNGASAALVVPVVLEFLGEDSALKGAPAAVRRLLSFFDFAPSELRLAIMAGAVLGLIVLKNLMTYVSTLSGAHLSRLFVTTVRREAIDVLMKVDLDFHARSQIGDLVHRANHEVARTAQAIAAGVSLATKGVTCFVFAGILVSISWQLTVVSMGLLTITGGLNQLLVRRGRQLGDELSSVSKRYTSALLEALRGIRLIKETSGSERWFNRLRRLMEERERVSVRTVANNAGIGPITEVAGVTSIFIMVILGRWLFYPDTQALAAVLLIYLVVLFRFLPVFTGFNRMQEELANKAASVGAVMELLQRFDKPFMQNGKQAFDGVEQTIAIQRVSFRYPGQKDLVLREVDLEIRAGTTLALVGESGSGKSTLAALLARLYDPTSGAVTIDGTDLRSFDLPSYHARIAIVSQDTFLFNDTVRANIAFDAPSATEEQLQEASRRAHALEFIGELPNGFDTVVGDRGVRLSGGQRQRIAIARALLRDPQILILDEATSALDNVSERVVQEAMDELRKDRTTLVIAHRLSTVESADRIAVLKAGRVVELGTHADLVGRSGPYAELCASQHLSQPRHVSS